VQLADGRVEFLAVAPARAGEADDAAADRHAAAPDAADRHAAASDATADAARVDAEQLPLPYALPE
jgi:hypothetical protein